MLLGVSDLAVQTVFRTVDGFVTPWVNWESSQPSGTAGHADGLDDRVTRAVNGKHYDGSVTATYKFYCEGNRLLYVSQFADCGPVIPIVSFVLAGDIHWPVYVSGRYSDSVQDGYRILFLLGAGMH